MIGAATRVFAVLGDPVLHSLSPTIHNAAFQALGLDAVYVALRLDAAAVPVVIRTLALGGGGGNVTVPHKQLAATLVAPIAGAPAGICNTFWGADGGVVGTSTDEIGIRKGWEGLDRPAGDWLILGTGGSARATALAAAGAGAGFVVRSRDPDRAGAFSAAMTALGARPGDPRAIGLVINCTPRGLAPDDPLPLPVDQQPAGAAALDLVYRPQGTPWVRALQRGGHRAADGRLVLLGQGAASLECWFPGVRAPTEVMSAALDRALR